MKWSLIHNILGWIFFIGGFILIITQKSLTIEWVFGLLTAIYGTHYWLESRVDKIEERFMI